MKKFLNLTLAFALTFQSFLGTGIIHAESTKANEELVESVEEVENLNDPSIEDMVENQEPIAEDKVAIENEEVEEMENPPQQHSENGALGLVSEDEDYGSDDYVIMTADGIMTLATATVGEHYRIPNTSYDFSSIISTWKTSRGMPKLYAINGGTEYAAFCIEPGVMHETGGSMSNGYNGLSQDKRDKIDLILMYGFGNNGDWSDDSYVATQVAIWEVVADQPSLGMLWGQLVQRWDNRVRLYAELLENVDKHLVRPSFMNDDKWNPKETTLDWNGSAYTTTLTDTNGVLSKYNVVSNNGDVQVSQNGNQLTLTTTNPNADVTLRLTKQATTGGSTLYWVSDTKQDVVTGGQDDPINAYLKVNIKTVGSYDILKKSTSGSLIQGAVFRITGNSYDQTFTTNANGKITLSNIPTGTYTVQEVSVPSPYILDTTPKTITIQPNKTGVVEFINDIAKGQIEVTKKYTVQEVSVPSPYILDTTPKTITIQPNKTGVVEFINDIAKGQIEVTKKSEFGALVQGAVFEIRNENGVVVDTITTGINGKATSSKLALGTYTVTEIAVPSPLILDSTPKTVTLNYANMTTPLVFGQAEFVNNVAKGYFKLQKVDSETGQATPQGSASLENAVYEVRDNQGVVVDTLKTDKNGYAESKVLPLGNYTIQEIQASEGYLIDPQIYSVSLSYSDMNTPVVTTPVTSNEQVMKQPIEIMKVQGEVAEQTLWNKLANFFSGGSGVMKPLEGAEFTITSKTTGQVVDVMVTNKDGYAKSIDLPYDTYIVSETKVPHNHYKADDFEVVINQNSSVPKTVTLNYANMTTPLVFGQAEFVNNVAKGYFKLQKVDSETGQATPQGSASLENAVYEVRDNQGVVVDTLKTDKNGYAESKVLPLGNYTIQEIQASEGYLIDPQIYSVSLSYSDMNTPVVTTPVTSNEQVMKQPIEIMKVQGEVAEQTLWNKLANFFSGGSGVMKPLEGAEFTITSKTTGQVVDVMVTNKDGYAKSIDLPYDTYIVSETKVPHNHYKADDFEVVINQNSSVPLHYTVANKPLTAYLKVVKVDEETGKVIPLSGVQFKIKNLDTGEYVKQKVTYPYPQTVEVFETNDEGMFITPKVLIYGNYQLEEIKAPNGYVILKEPVKFTIDQNDTFIDDVDLGLIKEVVVGNQAVKGQLNVDKIGEFLTDFKENETGIDFIMQ